MEYVECPRVWEPLSGQPGLFLAGGITGCPDWQIYAVRKLTGTNYAVLNPRREDWPIDDKDASEKQIVWEHQHLRLAHAILFWFCKETIQPIALYELGAWSMMNKPLFIGVEPGYQRAVDVELQTHLVRPEVIIHNSLDQLIREVVKFERLLRQS